MKYILSIFISVIAIFIIAWLGYNFLSWNFLESLAFKSPQQLGTTITTINATDLIKDSRTVINTNFTNLNNGKIEISTTSLPLITTLSGLTTAGSLSIIGTITTGTWHGSIITVPYGGSGWGSFQAYSVLIGNGTGAIATTSSGAEGSFLTYHVGSAPSWTSPSINTALDYDWTGTHIFHASTSIWKLDIVKSDGSATSTLSQENLNTLINNGDATNLHYHKGDCATGFGYQIGGTTGNQVISHGLGTTPSYIEMTAMTFSGSLYYSFGTATSTSANIATYYAADQAAQSTSSIIYLDDIGSAPRAVASITALTTTTFTLNWSVNAADGKTRFYQFEICK